MNFDASALPAELQEAVRGYRGQRETVGQSGGAVYRLQHPQLPCLYLKHGVGEVATQIIEEHNRLRWLAGRVAVPAVRGFAASDQETWLLTTPLPGQSAFACLAAAPEARPAIVAELVRFLRTLHALPILECPFRSDAPRRLAVAERRLAAGLIETDDFGAEHAGWTAEQVWRKAHDLLPAAEPDVVTHGDFSLDNVFLQDGRITGCLDVGRLGVADRYQDLAILSDCLGEFDRDLQEQVFREYGIAAIDERKLAFHLALDECF